MPNTIEKYNALKAALIERKQAYRDFILFPATTRNPNLRERLITHLKSIARPDEDIKPAIEFHVSNILRRVDLLFLEYCDEYRLYA